MGILKQDALRKEGLVSVCIGILCETKALKECENHGYYIDQGDSAAVSHAYALATDRYNKHHESMKEFRSLEEVTTIINEAYKEHGAAECIGCNAREKD